VSARRHAVAATLLLAALGLAGSARAEDACKASFESAQELRLEGKPLRARAELRLCAQVCPAVFAKECERWLGEVEPTIARASILVVDAERRVAAQATVTLDGATLPLDRWQTALELDPGPHAFSASAPGLGQGSAAITLKPGELRRVEITLHESAPLPAPLEEKRASRWPWWVVGGSGVAIAAAGLVTIGVGHAKRSEYEGACPCFEPLALSRRDEVRRLWISGGVLTGLGALAVGFATIGLATSAPSTSTKTASLGFAIFPGGLLVQGSF
jgi:hypothetical protein